MPKTKKQKTILVTFAGRKDRMSLLTRYVDAAIARGLIDEWHVWDFTRNADDARWLRERFPVVQMTPGAGEEYFSLPKTLALRGAARSLKFSVCAPSDVHIGLRRRGGGASYEIVLGGWSNRASAVRRFDDPLALTQMQRRDPNAPFLAFDQTTEPLPEFGFADVEIRVGAGRITAFVDGRKVVDAEAAIEDGDYEIFYRTGFGANGDWRFDA
jgi:hypothetical protein